MVPDYSPQGGTVEAIEHPGSFVYSRIQALYQRNFHGGLNPAEYLLQTDFIRQCELLLS